MPFSNYMETLEKVKIFDTKSFLRRLLFGLIIGVACITPGISGGVIVAAAGLYEPALHAITHLRKSFKAGFFYLLPLGLGAALGILIFGNVMQWLMSVAQDTVLYAFLGLVAGSLPALIREANRDGFRKRYLMVAGLGFFSILLLGELVGSLLPTAGLSLDLFGALLSGAAIAVGTVIPGISSSFLLLQLGTYSKLLTAFTQLNIPVLALVAVGCGITAFGLVFIADRLFKRFRGTAYYAVIGFLLGSIVTIFPGFTQGGRLVLDLALFAVCAAGSWLIVRLVPKQ